MAGHRVSGGHSVGHSSGGHRAIGGSFRASSGSSYRSSSSGRGFGSSGSSFGGSSYSSRRQSGGGISGRSLWGPGMYMLGKKSAHRDMQREAQRGGYYTNTSGTPYSAQGNNQQKAAQNTKKRNGCGTVILVFLIIMLIGMIFAAVEDQSGSTVVREKLTGVPAYDADCVADQLGVFGNVGTVQNGLEDFYNQTGIQPYVIFKRYDASLVSDAAMEGWANDFYDANIKEENGFLFVYFANNPDYGDGYITYVSGSETNAVMDDEAIDLFWGRIDKAWSDYGYSGFDSAIVKAYSDTATTIMRVSTTTNDVIRWALIVILAAVILGWILRMRKEKNRREKEKAEETERILNTPVEKIGDKSDELIDKYRAKTPEEVATEKIAAQKAAEAEAAAQKAAAPQRTAEEKIRAEMEAAQKAAAAEIAAERAAEVRAQADAAKKAEMGMQDPDELSIDPDDPLLKTFAESEADDLIEKYKDPQ